MHTSYEQNIKTTPSLLQYRSIIIDALVSLENQKANCCSTCTPPLYFTAANAQGSLYNDYLLDTIFSWTYIV